MNKSDFRRCIERAQEAGFTIVSSDYNYWSFGNWTIVVSGGGVPDQQIWWDGRDNWFGINALASDADWFEKWVGRTNAEQRPEVVIEKLAEPLSPTWERDIRRIHEEYWQKHLLEQALRQASLHWDRGDYVQVVRELESVADRLTPAQSKKLEIARRHVSDGH